MKPRQRTTGRRKAWEALWPDKDYLGLDAGIRFAVRVLHAAGIETCQSCEGGKGHSYPEPSIDMVAGGADATGFAALRVLWDNGLPVNAIAIVWSIRHGLPYEKLWRITFARTMEDRADEWPMFVYGYRVHVCKAIPKKPRKSPRRRDDSAIKSSRRK